MSDSVVIPEEFTKVIKDFVQDIQTTFPEFQSLIHKWWKNQQDFEYIENKEERESKFLEAQGKSIQILYRFCTKKFPPRFFDILYQNEEIFKEDSEFLPHIHFKTLWELDISQKTKDTIWKYLQLILFSVIGNLENKESFGADTAKLFEAINNDDFKSKLEETLEQIQGLFQKGSEDDSEQAEEQSSSGSTEKNANANANTNSFPNAEQLHDHISSMMNGKLGQLAREIAEETADSFNLDMENTGDMKDVFQKLLKNPTKLMSLVKNVGDKLDSKMKSGEIKESELMAEATEIFNRMKNTPGMGGMGDIQSMLSKMGLGGAGGKLNMGAMEAQLNRNMKMAQMKERMKANIGKKNVPTAEQVNHQSPTFTEEELVEIFEKDKQQESTKKTSKKKDKSKKTKK